MTGSSTQPSEASSISRWSQIWSGLTSLAFCFCLPASSLQAYPQTMAAPSGLVIESLMTGSTLFRSGLQTGDVITHWAPPIPRCKTRRQPDSAFNWLWFTSELLPRGPVKVTFIREGRLFETIVSPGSIGARVHPALPEGDLLLYSGMAHLLSKNSASEAALLGEELFQRQSNSTPAILAWASHLTATAYTRAQNLPEAMVWYSKALESTQDPLARAYIWQSIGIAHQEAGQTREAESAYQTALSITQSALPGSLVETTSLRALYVLAWKSRDLENVRRYASREADILSRQAPRSLQQADSWEMLAILSSRAGHAEQARTHHQEALALRRAIEPESRDTARSLINLGNLNLQGEAYDAASALYKDALAILQRAAPGSPELSSVYANLGRVESALGRLAEAERMYRAALEHTDDDEVGRLSTLRSLSYLAQKLGDFIQAEEWSRQAVESMEKRAPQSSEMADSLASLATIRFQMGDMERARDLFTAALSINQKLSRSELDIAAGLNNVATVLNRIGETASAEELWKRALEIHERNQPGTLSAARVLHNLGQMKRSGRREQEAVDMHQRALAIQMRWAPTSVDTVTTLRELGTALRDLGQPEQALIHHAAAVAISQQVPLAEVIQAQALHEKSITLRRLERSLEALDTLRSAVYLLEAQTGRILGTDDNRTQFRSKFSAIYRDYIHALVDHGQERAAFAAQEMFLARGFALLLSERDMTFRDVPPELEAKRAQLAARYDLAQRELVAAYAGKDDEQIERLTRELRDIRDRQSTNDLMRRRSSHRLSSFSPPEPLSLETAQSSLHQGTLALSYNVHNEAFILFALMADGTFRVHRIEKESGELRREISQLTLLLRQRPTALRRNNLLSQAKSLYRTLLGPVDDLIDRSRRILLVPDGPLHELAFAALVKDTPGSSAEKGWNFLIEHRPLHLVSSLTTSSLQSARQEQIAGRDELEGLVAFGDPAYPLQGDRSLAGDPHVRAAFAASSLTPLPWSRREVESIGKLFPGHSKLYLGKTATEGAAKEMLVNGKYRYVHFAGHGHLDQDFPLNSAVVLTIPQIFRSGEDNGLLQAWEIFESVRLDADLVVLSACESGLGKEMGGEGLIGLTRAFQYAGARSVMASLWKISDRTTAELMVRFYRYLKEGLPKDEALRAAQRELIRAPIQVTSDKGEQVEFDASAPYYWAAFQIYGDWQ